MAFSVPRNMHACPEVHLLVLAYFLNERCGATVAIEYAALYTIYKISVCVFCTANSIPPKILKMDCSLLDGVTAKCRVF